MITLAVDTYVTVAEARAYAEDNTLSLPDSDDELERLLKNGSKFLDRKWGRSYMGQKAEAKQTMGWPRRITRQPAHRGEFLNYTTDADGNPRDFNGLQPELKEAVTELAAMMYAEASLYDQPTPALTSETTKLDVLTTQVAYETAHAADPFYKIRMILRPLLTAPTGITIVRGA